MKHERPEHAAPESAAADRTARERLLLAAASLFARKGYAGTSVGEIVAAAAVTRPVLYYWFRSKEGIFLRLIEGALERFEGDLDEARAVRGPAPRRLHAVCARVVEQVVENLDIARLIYALSYGPPQGAPAIDVNSLHGRVRGAIREQVESGLAEGSLRGEAEDIQWATIGVVSICVELGLSHPALVPDLRGLFDRLFATLMSGIAAPTAKERKKR